jgi:hypothetical protein
MTAPTTVPQLDRTETPDPALGALPRDDHDDHLRDDRHRDDHRDRWWRHPAVVEGRHVVRVRADELARRRARRRSRREWAGVVVAWGLLTVVLLAIGTVVAVRHGALPGDALSRVQSARAMVAGRDPHPEAIGFVWGPFPTLFEAPFVWLARWWAPLASAGVAAVAVSALALSTASVQMFGWGRDVGCPRWLCTLVVALMLAHPLVWTSGVNGMSEAVWFLFLIVAGRRLTRWMDTDDVVSLAIAGLALGMAYLARYESLASIAAVAVLVAAVSFRWSSESALVPPEHRLSAERSAAVLVRRPLLRAALLDATIVAFPALSAVLTWSLVCWAIVGEPFPQLTSEYGNAAIVEAAGESIAGIVGDTSAVGRGWFFVRQVSVAAAVALPLAALVAWRSGRTAWRGAAAVAVLGAPLVLQALFSLQGSTFPWFRYVAAGVLLAAVLYLILAADLLRNGAPRWLVGAAVLVLVPSVVLATGVVRSGQLGAFDEEQVSAAVLDSVRGDAPDRRSSISARGGEVAAYIDGLEDASAGSVLTDTSSTFAVVAAAARPELYIVPSDRDFEPIVADPARFGVRYLLLRGPGSAGDALRARFPGLWDGDLSAVAVPVATWGAAGDESGHYRLLRVVDPQGPPPQRPGLDDGAGS